MIFNPNYPDTLPRSLEYAINEKKEEGRGEETDEKVPQDFTV